MYLEHKSKEELLALIEEILCFVVTELDCPFYCLSVIPWERGCGEGFCSNHRNDNKWRCWGKYFAREK